MLRFPERLVLSGVACALLVAVGLLAWPLATDSSEAQAGSMHNCPPSGKWSIAVWDGASSTAAADALATCGADAVQAAYSLDPQTGAWSRWFAGKPDVSNLPPLSDMQGVLALGSAAPPPTQTPTPAPTPGGPGLETWSGTSSQGRLIEFDVVEESPGSQAIKRIKVNFEGTFSGSTCGWTIEVSWTIGSPVIVDNVFSYSGSTFDVSGTFDSATTASGELHVHDPGYSGPGGWYPCDSGPLEWTASLQ